LGSAGTSCKLGIIKVTLRSDERSNLTPWKKQEKGNKQNQTRREKISGIRVKGGTKKETARESALLSFGTNLDW